MTNDPDLILIDRVLAGEQHVFAELVDKHKRYAFTIALKILQDRGEAEEAAQDSFVKAYHHLVKFNREAKFSTWFYRIVFNTAISYKRKQKANFQDIEHTVIHDSADVESTLERDDKQKYLSLALTKLNDQDRTALSLFYLDEFSLEEIGEITGLPTNTMKVRIHRARQKLAEELKLILSKEALTL
ncbi:RNA polymerase sigma factor [Pseudochryseolinea flava]|uniref:RNA polymerase subunit sigma n=1 Tax=Pseudochryseolinea flava TaxID=2059302 RepID=A0A364Y317_9BACT|nr:sigma-70 family RNA polymerase sigma factor [Pseudochryseolinea flava]RAW00166.1 RNA polymerase subunit sigma [Pseudochryseolinea flava]